MKLLYETLNQSTLTNFNRFYPYGYKEISPLEPRRSNPLDRYQSTENPKEILSTSNHDSIKQISSNVSNDDEPSEQYLQVDPRCYVRQNSTISTGNTRKSDIPRLEKGLSLNVDTRSTSLSPYRQSSFDVTLAYRSGNQTSPTPSPAISSQQESFFTPRGSNLSVMGQVSTNTSPPDSQHLSPPTTITSRPNSAIEKKDLNVQIQTSGRTSTIRTSIVSREHEHSRSLEHSTTTNNSTVDKQFRSFDAVHLLRPITQRHDLIRNYQTKSFEQSFIAPPPIVIKIPDMRELVQAVKLSQSEDRWYQFEDATSPEDLTSTSIDSAGAMAIEQTSTNLTNEHQSQHVYRRKSSSNLLVPPPEVRRQALRRTFEKRRQCINQSNARREQDIDGVDDDSHQTSTIKSTDFSSLLTNFNTKSENSSFDRSLETDFDLQSESSSRGGPTDHFTSIESSGNENPLPETNFYSLKVLNQSSQLDDSGYKSVDSQHSQIHTFSLDRISTDGGNESLIHFDNQSKQQDDNHERLINVHLPVQSNTSFNRTASRKRREFSKDKRHASSNFEQKINDGNTRQIPSSSTLQVRHPDLRRSKSDQADSLEHSINLPTPITPLSSSADRIIRHQSTQLNTTTLRSPNPQLAAFRSKRGSISFDNPVCSISSTQMTPKPRFKFSMVRDSTTNSLGSSSFNNTMPLANDLSFDEKTDRIINEYLMKENRTNSSIRQQTFDETMIKHSQFKSMIKQRQYSVINEKSNNKSQLLPEILIQQDNGLAFPSPSIIVTGYDSGS